jgi:hypothetical protein
MVLHLPWFMVTTKVTVDGKPAAVSAGAVDVPVGARTINLQWSKSTNVPAMSYQKAVADYKVEYRKRYEASLHE